MEAVFRDDRPDLVISGCNYGENAGAYTNLSGTVGVAVTALSYGVPAIACSAEGDHSDPTYGTPDYAGSARFLVGVVDYLDKHRQALAGMAQEGVSVNYPFLSSGASPKGVKLAAPEPISALHLRYTPTPANPMSTKSAGYSGHPRNAIPTSHSSSVIGSP